MKYEIKKILCDKIIWIAIAVLFVLAVFYSTTNDHAYLWMDREVFDSYCGIYNEETLESLPSSGKSEAERVAYLKVGFIIENQQQILNERYNTAKRALKLSETGNEFSQFVNKRIYEIYIREINFEIYDSNLISDNVTEYQIGFVKIGLLFLIAIITIRIFNIDVDNSMISMLRSSKRGRLKVYLNKFLAVFIVSAVINIIILLISLLPLFRFGHLSDLLQPIQSLSMMNMSPYLINNLEYIIIVYILTLLGTAAFIGGIIILCNVFRKIIVSISISTLLIGFEYVFSKNMLNESLFTNDLLMRSSNIFVVTARWFTNIFMLFRPQMYLESIEYLYGEGIMINSIVLVIIINIVLAVGLFFIGYLVYTKNGRKSI